MQAQSFVRCLVVNIENSLGPILDDLPVQISQGERTSADGDGLRLKIVPYEMPGGERTRRVIGERRLRAENLSTHAPPPKGRDNARDKPAAPNGSDDRIEIHLSQF